MANENKEIFEIVKKCKILLLDIEGTTTSISFVKDELFPYAEKNVKQFLDSQWENADVKEAVAALRKLSIEDKNGSVEGVVEIPGEDAPKEEQIDGLVKSVKWQMASDRKAGPLKKLQGLIWRQGYDNGDIKGHVFDDVSPALEAWRATDGQKVYIYSSGSVQAQKLLFGQSVAGDLLKLIDGHFDTAVGGKQDAASYTAIVEQIGCKPDEILFLTDILKEAEAACAAGVRVGLVARAGNAPLPADAAGRFPVLASLADLAVSNKRKPDPQDVETPAAKILKTEVEQSVKTSPETAVETESAKATTSETVPKENATPETASTETAEQMEVEGTNSSSKVTKTAAEVKEQIIVEEMDSNEANSVTSVVDVEPTAVEIPEEEKEQKTVEKETVKKPEEPMNEKGDSPVEQESGPVEVMEVEEVTDDKTLPDVAEIVKDVMPIVEEPDNAEAMEELKNVGEVLDKECGEILSKVNNVTNLENITAKPMLNPIAEETMETDSGDTNDIVDRILDSELEIEMKQCAEIDPNIITEMTEEAKTELVENNEPKEDKKENENKEIVSEKEENVSESNITAKQEMDSENSEIVKEKKENSAEKEESITENNVEKVVESSPKEDEPHTTNMEDAQIKESRIEVSPAAEVTTNTESKQTVEDKNSTEDAVNDEVKSAEIEIAKESPVEEVLVKEDNTTETAPQESKVETEVSQLNGKATNGDAVGTNGDAKDKEATDVDVNGDASKEEEISARLTDATVENGKVNGSNGESMDGEKGQGDCQIESESNDIKVKSVTMDEPRTDPIEQPTEEA